MKLRDSNNRAYRPGPDFLCIGMQKAGTDFLFDCLLRMSEFHVPLRKEIHHFDQRGKVNPRSRQVLLRVAAQLDLDLSDADTLYAQFQELRVRPFFRRRVTISGRVFVLDRLNVDFLKSFSTYVLKHAGDEEYLGLFSSLRNHVSGDITPAYSTLDDDQIARVHRLLPETKIVLCVREPVSRLWSQLNMRARADFRQRFGRKAEKSDVDEFDRLLSPERVEVLVRNNSFLYRSMPGQVYRKWTEAYGLDNILVINFDDLILKTQKVLDRFSGFMGVRPEKNIVLPLNIKQDDMKVPLDAARRDVLESALGDELSIYHTVFGMHGDRV